MSVVRKNRLGPYRPILTPLDGQATEHGYLYLTSPPPSLNHLFATVGKMRVKSPTYRGWLTTASLQIRRQNSWHIPGKTRVFLTFNRKQTGADLDNLIKPILDLLVNCGRIEDDKNVVEVRALFSDTSLGTEINLASEQWSAGTPFGCSPAPAKSVHNIDARVVR